jgi:alkaline phosphatase D
MACIVDRRRLLAASAGALALDLPGRAFAQAASGFTHSVASGEPLQTSIVLWTRYVTASPVRLCLEIADDPAFQRIALTGEAEASPATDCCARVIAEGLAPGRWYHFRFVAPDGQASDVGRTR